MKVGRCRNYDNVDVRAAKEPADIGVAMAPVVGGEIPCPAAAIDGHQRRSWHMPRGDLGPRASHEPGADDTDAYNHAMIRMQVPWRSGPLGASEVIDDEFLDRSDRLFVALGLVQVPLDRLVRACTNGVFQS